MNSTYFPFVDVHLVFETNNWDAEACCCVWLCVCVCVSWRFSFYWVYPNRSSIFDCLFVKQIVNWWRKFSHDNRIGSRTRSLFSSLFLLPSFFHSLSSSPFLSLSLSPVAFFLFSPMLICYYSSVKAKNTEEEDIDQHQSLFCFAQRRKLIK